MLLYLAMGLYLINLGVGAAAQFTHLHFGKWHHLLYFIVFLAAIGAVVRHFHPALLLTLTMLALMPKSKPGTWRHPAAALLGFTGYLVTIMN
ncbi:MAG: hypothetical protein KJ063_22945 [Anaerolineae bacterium]|nr:hypothetical protein [Anaerolineae bacterium]